MRISSAAWARARSESVRRPEKASRTRSSRSSPRERSYGSARALQTLTKRFSIRTPVWTRSTWLGAAVASDLMALPLLVLLLKLGVRNGRRALQGFDARAQVLCGAPDYAEWVGPTLANCLKRRGDLLF